jgi:hypothetical protein
MLVIPDPTSPGDMRQVHGPTVKEAAFSARNAAARHDILIKIIGNWLDKMIPAIASLQEAAGIEAKLRVDYREPAPAPAAVDGTEVDPGPDQALMERPDGSKYWQPVEADRPVGDTLISVGPKPPTQKTGMEFIKSTARVAGFGGPAAPQQPPELPA